LIWPTLGALSSRPQYTASLPVLALLFTLGTN